MFLEESVHCPRYHCIKSAPKTLAYGAMVITGADLSPESDPLWQNRSPFGANFLLYVLGSVGIVRECAP